MTFTLVVGAAPAAGADDFYRGLLVSANAVVAADAAGPWCAALGRTPDVVVGDFDETQVAHVDAGFSKQSCRALAHGRIGDADQHRLEARDRRGQRHIRDLDAG